MNRYLKHSARTALAILSMTGMVHAGATAYEPFDYSSLESGTVATGDGFTGEWACGTAGQIVSGLTYSGLPTASSALQSSGARQTVSLSSPLSGGTKWISFLFKTSAGNPGANINGVYFPNDQSDSLWFGFGLSPYSGTQGQLGLGSMATAGTTATGASTLELLELGTYGATYLVVLKIEFNTSGNNDTVTVYLNPTANQPEPGVDAVGSCSTFDIGSISGVGLNVSGAGSVTIDEIRVADSYADVVDAVIVAPDAPTGLNAVAGINQVRLSWTLADGSPTGYNIKRAADAEGPYTNVVGTVTTSSYVDTVAGGQTYYYVVSAFNSTGESPDSAYAVASPLLPPPFEASIAQGVGISWFASNNITYQVQWSEAEQGTNTVWNDLGNSFRGAGATNTLFDADGEAHNVYRVISFQ
ncbi:MAG: fibronectin type III domain-containing protein [Pontiellaceae bacterium]|nr:fibronectin type III domain-containing protein [Pontiellaceae bacterium]MBN2785993.1 fibronectin type III domain-containing protein [Pontiellaceae bacterium]